MSMNFSGFDELINDLNNLGNIGNKIGKQAVSEAAEVILKQQKKDAPRDPDDNEHGADKLEVTEIKKYSKSGTTVAKIGISSDNWEDAKGLWFQNFGFEHYKSGKLVDPHVGWMKDSLKKCEDKAAKAMMDLAKKEIDKIL